MELNSTVTAFDPISKSTKLSLAGRCLVSACGFFYKYIFLFFVLLKLFDELCTQKCLFIIAFY